MITLGLLTYKRNDDVIETINILSKSGVDNVELIVVDNNKISQQSIIEGNIFIPTTWSLIYHSDGINKGVGQGRNEIFKLATNDVIIFFDDDVVVDEFKELVKITMSEFNMNPKLSAIAYNVVDYSTGVISDFEFPHKNKKLKEKGDFSTYYFVGAGHAIRKKEAVAVGCYSSGLGLYGMEEVELSYKMISAGKNIKYLSKLVVRHKRSPTGRITSRDVIFNSFFNKTTIAARHLESKYYYSHFIAWAFKFGLSTRELRTIFNVFIETFRIHKKSNIKFSSNFYSYCKSCNAWLWW